MPPLRRQPGVVEIQVANEDTQVECCLGWLQLVGRTWNPGATLHFSAGNHGAEQLRTTRKFQGQHGTSQAVHEAMTSGGVCLVAVDFVIADVVCDIYQNLIGWWSVGGANTNL